MVEPLLQRCLSVSLVYTLAGRLTTGILVVSAYSGAFQSSSDLPVLSCETRELQHPGLLGCCFQTNLIYVFWLELFLGVYVKDFCR